MFFMWIHVWFCFPFIYCIILHAYLEMADKDLRLCHDGLECNTDSLSLSYPLFRNTYTRYSFSAGLTETFQELTVNPDLIALDVLADLPHA